MKYRVFPLFLLVATLAVLSGSLDAGDKKNTHEGKFVKATSAKEFVMEDKGKEHTHTLSADAKVTGTDGKECKLDDLKKGQMIRVTTKEGDMTIATRVEALKKERE